MKHELARRLYKPISIGRTGGDRLTWACAFQAKWTEANTRTQAASLLIRSQNPHGHFRLLVGRARERESRLADEMTKVEVSYLARQ